MNTITTTNLFISTLEISTLTGKEHKNVLRDTREMISELEKEDGSVLSHEQYQEVTDNRGYTKEILLSKYLTEILVTGYSIVLRARVIKRLHELEQELQNTPKLPSNYLEALQFLLESETQKQLLIEENTHMTQKIEEDKPKVLFSDTVSNSTTNLSITDYAKSVHSTTNMGRNQMFKFLRDKKIFTKDNLPYQSYINKGYFKVVESVYKGHISVTTTITPLGQQKLLSFIVKGTSGASVKNK